MIFYLTPEQWENIPEAYKEESNPETGGKTCFSCFLSRTTPGNALCFENKHFLVTDHRPEYNVTNEHNGGYAVKCLESEKAKSFYDKEKTAGNLTVYEWINHEAGAPLDHWILYAYAYKDEFADGLTEKELEETLEKLADSAIET